MALESGSFISDLVSTNPVGATDKRSQGDDHLRLIKTLVKATFPNATAAFYFPFEVAKSGNYTVVGTDQNSMILGNATAAGFTLALTAAATLGSRFRFTVMKTDATANTITIDPNGAELINGASTFVLTKQWDAVDVFCDGTSFYAASIPRNVFNNLVLQVFVANGTYTPTTAMQFVLFGAVGSGGGSGGVQNSADIGGGGGGGGGSTSLKVSTAAAVGASQAVTIGAAASGGGVGLGGSNGNDTSLGALCIGKGGAGGGGAAANNAGAGGAGGVAGTGDITVPGQAGQAGAASAAVVTPVFALGMGGSSGLGFGAGAPSTGGVVGNGLPGGLYGGGASGAFSRNSAGAGVGNVSGQGIAFALEFCRA